MEYAQFISNLFTTPCTEIQWKDYYFSHTDECSVRFIEPDQPCLGGQQKIP